MVDARRRRMLDAMGVAVWSERAAPLGADLPLPSPPEAAPASPRPALTIPELPPAAPPAVREPAVASSGAVATLGWAELRRRVVACVACGLHASRTQTVFGVGDEAADWLFVGEAPGADEDAQGEPFVGRGGQLLTSMIAALGMRREQVFIANILKCRPPNNRDPQPDEVGHCLPYLARQVALIQPKIIVCVGRIAAQNLLGVDTPIGKLRGTVHAYRDSGIPVVVTYHPAYLLRSPTEKRKAWDDLKLARRTYQAQRQGPAPGAPG